MNRQSKHRSAVKKGKAKRKIHRTILLICEGEQTEDRYLKSFKHETRKQNIRIEIKSGFSSPDQLVEEAVLLFEQSENQYDEIHCIFDKDEHHHFHKALENIKQYNKKFQSHVVLYETISNPCFEIWFLLHFKYSTKSFYTIPGGNRAKDLILKEIGNDRFKQTCKKNPAEIYSMLKPLLDKALDHAKKLETQQGEHPHTKNPYTAMHKLVEKVFL